MARVAPRAVDDATRAGDIRERVREIGIFRLDNALEAGIPAAVKAGRREL